MTQNLAPLAVSAAEAARLLGVSKPKIYDLIAQEDFPSFKVGKRTLISVDGLRKWINRQAGVSETDSGERENAP